MWECDDQKTPECFFSPRVIRYLRVLPPAGCLSLSLSVVSDDGVTSPHCWTQLQPWLPSAAARLARQYLVMISYNDQWWSACRSVVCCDTSTPVWWTECEQCYHQHHPRGRHQLPSTTTNINNQTWHQTVSLSLCLPGPITQHYCQTGNIYVEFLSDQTDITAWSETEIPSGLMKITYD